MKKIIVFVLFLTCILLVSCQNTNKSISEITPTLKTENTSTVTPTAPPTITPTATAMPLVNAVPEDELLVFFDSTTDLTGYINNKGEWIIPAKYYTGYRFSKNENMNNWAIVYLTQEDYTNGNRKLIDDKGILSDFNWDLIVTEPTLDFASNGLSVKKDPITGKDGYVNEKGEWAISPIYEHAFKFSDNGLARVLFMEYDNYGPYYTSHFIDQNGLRKTPSVITVVAGDFALNGLAYVCPASFTSYTREFEYEMLAYYFGEDEPFSDDLYVKLLTFQGEYQLFDENGDFAAVNHGKNSWIDTWVHSYSKTGNYCGYMNETGEFVIPVKFLDARSYNEAGYAFVKDVWYEGKWGIIDEKGVFAVEPQFYNTTDYEVTLMERGSVKNEEGKWGFIDDKGAYFIQPQFADARWFDNADVAWVKNDDNLWGLINRKGEYIIEPTYKNVSMMSDDFSLYWVQTAGELWGLIDSKNSYWIEPQFMQLSFIYDKYGIALVQTNEGEWFYVNFQGEPIIGDAFAVPAN